MFPYGYFVVFSQFSFSVFSLFGELCESDSGVLIVTPSFLPPVPSEGKGNYLGVWFQSSRHKILDRNLS